MLDVVNVIYLDGDAEFDPTTMKTQFTQIFIIVKEHTEMENGKLKRGFRVAFTSSDEVPKFVVNMPNPSIFYDYSELHQFILYSCTLLLT